MPEGGRTLFEYLPLSIHAAELERQVTDGRGFITTYTLNRYGSVTQIADPMGHITQMSWQENDVVMDQRIDANGVVTNYSYDEYGNPKSETVLQVTDFDGAQHDYVTLYEYWPPLGFDPPFIKNRVRRKTNRNGAVTEYHYDKRGNLLSETVVGTDHTIQHTYYPNGDRKTTTDAKSNITRFGHDLYGYPDVITEPLDKVTDTDYDIRGRLTQSTDALSNNTNYTYDALNRLTLTRYPEVDGVIAETIVNYDDASGRYTETDATGYITIIQTDREGRTTHIQTPLTEKAFDYDEEGNKELESFWFNAETPRRDMVFSYDSSGRLESKTEPLARVTTYRYDNVGNLIQETLQGPAEQGEFLARISRYRYDGLNRRIEESRRLNDNEWATVSTQYDGMGNPILILDPLQHQTQQHFDDLNRLRQRIDALGQLIEYDYDANGNQIQVIHQNQPQNQTRSWEYDALNRMKKAINAEEKVTEYDYDKVGNLTQIIDARLNVIKHDYDARNRRKATRAKLDRISRLGEAITPV